MALHLRCQSHGETKVRALQDTPCPNGPHHMPSNSPWPQFHHALPVLFGSPASTVMGCDGCLRAALCENRSWCGSVSHRTMGREWGSSLQASLLSLTLFLIHSSSSLPSLFIRPFSSLPLLATFYLSFSLSDKIPPSPPPLVFAMLLFSRICQTLSCGMLQAASFHLLLWHSNACSLWVGSRKRRSQFWKWTWKFSLRVYILVHANETL